MAGIASVVRVAVLVQLAHGSAVPEQAFAEPSQCLMQQKHQMARSSDMQGKGRKLIEELPTQLLDLARKIYTTDDAIEGALENTVQVDVTHAGVPIVLKMPKTDDATTRLGTEGTWFSYDLDTLGDGRDHPDDMLNMIDVGGNYGVVTIAAMKKYPNSLRVVAVEPSPITFFFLKWNLYLNGVPEISDESELQNKAGAPGVLALNSGSADVAGQDLHFCFYPESSMNSKICDCNPDGENCKLIPSTTVDKLVDMFGTQRIAMVKMDCEGCEFKCLPALAQPHLKDRVHRLAGELHIPDENIEKLACGWDNGRLVQKCQHSAKNYNDIECGVELSCQF